MNNFAVCSNVFKIDSWVRKKVMHKLNKFSWIDIFGIINHFESSWSEIFYMEAYFWYSMVEPLVREADALPLHHCLPKCFQKLSASEASDTLSVYGKGLMERDQKANKSLSDVHIAKMVNGSVIDKWMLLIFIHNYLGVIIYISQHWIIMLAIFIH